MPSTTLSVIMQCIARAKWRYAIHKHRDFIFFSDLGNDPLTEGDHETSLQDHLRNLTFNTAVEENIIPDEEDAENMDDPNSRTDPEDEEVASARPPPLTFVMPRFIIGPYYTQLPGDDPG